MYSCGHAERGTDRGPTNKRGYTTYTTFTSGGGQGRRPGTHTTVTSSGREGHRPRSHATITLTFRSLAEHVVEPVGGTLGTCGPRELALGLKLVVNGDRCVRHAGRIT